MGFHGARGAQWCFMVLHGAAPPTVRPLARDPRVLIGWPFPLGFGLDGRLLLARRGRVYVQFIIIRNFPRSVSCRAEIPTFLAYLR